MADRDAKRKRPITCLETGVTFESAYRAAKELGFADSRNIFRSIQRGTCTQGRHRRDVRVGIPGGPRVRHRRRGRAHIGQHGRRTQRAPLLLRRRAETGPGVLQGTTFEDQAHRLPGNRRDLRRQPGRRAPPARIAGRHQPGRSLRNARRRAPFLPWRRAETGSGVLQAGEGERRQEPRADGGRGKGRRWELGSPGRWPAAPTRGIIDAVGKAPSVSEGAFLRLLGTVSVFMRRARRFPAGPAFPWVSLMAEGFLVPGKKTLKGVIG